MAPAETYSKGTALTPQSKAGYAVTQRTASAASQKRPRFQKDNKVPSLLVSMSSQERGFCCQIVWTIE
jgi:hypothetical protein